MRAKCAAFNLCWSSLERIRHCYALGIFFYFNLLLRMARHALVVLLLVAELCSVNGFFTKPIRSRPAGPVEGVFPPAWRYALSVLQYYIYVIKKSVNCYRVPIPDGKTRWRQARWSTTTRASHRPSSFPPMPVDPFPLLERLARIGVDWLQRLQRMALQWLPPGAASTIPMINDWLPPGERFGVTGVPIRTRPSTLSPKRASTRRPWRRPVSAPH